MNTIEALRIAGVPDYHFKEAENSLQLADDRIKGLLLHKAKTRWFEASKIAKELKWENNRLIEVRPDWAKKDIAPMLNITCNGDFIEWVETPDGGRPYPDCWLNPDPESEDYKRACEINYRYFKGLHPRSYEARVIWYRRNAGEYLAYDRGVPITAHEGFEIWRGQEEGIIVSAWRAGAHWMVNTSKPWIGSYHLKSRKGFEIDNIFCGKLSPQLWFPIPGYQLRAPVSYSTLPRKGGDSMEFYGWEDVQMSGGKAYTNYTF